MQLFYAVLLSPPVPEQKYPTIILNNFMFIDRKAGDIIRNMLILYTNIKVGNFKYFFY